MFHSKLLQNYDEGLSLLEYQNHSIDPLWFLFVCQFAPSAIIIPHMKLQ